MAQDSSSNRPVPVTHRRDRTKFTKEQLKILIDTFNQTPYLDYDTRQRLALELNTEVLVIQYWFQNRRAKHPSWKRRQSKEALESSQEPGQDHLPDEFSSEELRRRRITYSPSQMRTLMKAFRNNPYLRIHCRRQLAEEIGVPEQKVHNWFQNRRSRLGMKRKKEPDESFNQGQEQDIKKEPDESFNQGQEQDIKKEPDESFN